MTQKIQLLTLSIAAAAVLLAERFITVGGAVATGAGNAVGVTESSAAAIGDLVPTTVLGTAIVTAGGAIAAGAAIEVGTAGKAVTRASGVTVARMAPGSVALADGDRVEVILIPN